MQIINVISETCRSMSPSRIHVQLYHLQITRDIFDKINILNCTKYGTLLDTERHK